MHLRKVLQVIPSERKHSLHLIEKESLKMPSRFHRYEEYCKSGSCCERYIFHTAFTLLSCGVYSWLRLTCLSPITTISLPRAVYGICFIATGSALLCPEELASKSLEPHMVCESCVKDVSFTTTFCITVLCCAVKAWRMVRVVFLCSWLHLHHLLYSSNCLHQMQVYDAQMQVYAAQMQVYVIQYLILFLRSARVFHISPCVSITNFTTAILIFASDRIFFIYFWAIVWGIRLIIRYISVKY